MTLLLTNGTFPEETEVKSASWKVGSSKYGYTSIMGTDEILLSMEDFVSLAVYVLTNTNLQGDDDPRLAFVERVKAFRLEDGFPGPQTEPKRIVLG